MFTIGFDFENNQLNINIYLFINLNYFTFRTEYQFNFNDKFEIHDDIEVLKRMGMDFGNFTILF